MDTRIYICTHKEFNPPQMDGYIPIRVGSAIAESDFSFLRDDTGDNISEKNMHFCELTGLYWIWKNVECDIAGLCHYRRFLQNEGRILERGYIEKLICEDGYDLIAPASGSTDYGTNYGHYAKVHHTSDFDITREVLHEKYPDYDCAFELFSHTNLASLANMVIAKKQVLDEYCEWLFDILFEVEKRTDVSGYDAYQSRLYGYLSERLFRIWILMHGYRVREEQVLLVDGI